MRSNSAWTQQSTYSPKRVTFSDQFSNGHSSKSIIDYDYSPSRSFKSTTNTQKRCVKRGFDLDHALWLFDYAKHLISRKKHTEAIQNLEECMDLLL